MFEWPLRAFSMLPLTAAELNAILESWLPDKSHDVNISLRVAESSFSTSERRYVLVSWAYSGPLQYAHAPHRHCIIPSEDLSSRG